MDSNKELEVKSPLNLDREDVESVLQKKKPWILEKINRIEEETWPPKNKEFLSGEKILYNGRRYLMKVKPGNSVIIEFNGDKFLIHSSSYSDQLERRKEVARELKNWYNNQASKRLIQRTSQLSSEVGKQPEEVTITDYENKWGETKSGKITLHWRLIMAPQEIQDYVIAHELCHLKVNDHSEAFWNTLKSIVPDYERRREWLRKNGQKLTIS